MKKVCIIGPECTGKTLLSSTIASHYSVLWVQEVARAYLEEINRPYTEEDLWAISQMQAEEEDVQAAKGGRMLVCDTNLLTIKIWSEFKYHRCDPRIVALHETRTYDLYLFTYIDVPWEEDPQREHPHLRKELWDIYDEELRLQPTPCLYISGGREQRLRQALTAIDHLLLNEQLR